MISTHVCLYMYHFASLYGMVLCIVRLMICELDCFSRLKSFTEPARTGGDCKTEALYSGTKAASCSPSMNAKDT